MLKPASDPLKNDPDRSKGAEEPDSPDQASNSSLAGQLGHRKPNGTPPSTGSEQEGADTDFPEPSESPEHSFEGEGKETGS